MAKLILTVLAITFTFNLFGQNKLNELNLIQDQNFTKHEYDKRKVSYLFKENKNYLVKYNPVSLVFGGLLFLYQKGISPQISVNCPYEISCSKVGFKTQIFQLNVSKHQKPIFKTISLEQPN